MNVLAQAKAGVKELLIILVGAVQIMNQAHQSHSVKTRELCLNICPGRLRGFGWFLHGFAARMRRTEVRPT
jgi:hypothetical protein